MVVLAKSVGREENEAALRELFSRYGRLVHLEVAPLNTLTVVQYESADQAQSALQKAGQRRGARRPLLLEMAPITFERNVATAAK